MSWAKRMKGGVLFWFVLGDRDALRDVLRTHPWMWHARYLDESGDSYFHFQAARPANPDQGVLWATPAMWGLVLRPGGSAPMLDRRDPVHRRLLDAHKLISDDFHARRAWPHLVLYPCRLQGGRVPFGELFRRVGPGGS